MFAALALFVLAAAVSVVDGSTAGWWFLAGCGCALVVVLVVAGQP